MIANSIIKKKIEENPNFCYLIKIANEHLSEYVDRIDNIVEPLTGFTGDTAFLYVDRFGMSLLVDSRFVIQAKLETNNIEIVNINSFDDLCDFLLNKTRNIDIYNHIEDKELLDLDINLYLDFRLFSYDYISKLTNRLEGIYNAVVNDCEIVDAILEHNKNEYKNYIEQQQNRKLFVYNKNLNIIKKLPKLFQDHDYSTYIYISSDLSEIANITGLRLRPSRMNDDLLFNSFLIMVNDSIFLYTDYILEDNNNKHFIIKKYCDFYNDIKNIKQFLITNNLFVEMGSKLYINPSNISKYILDILIENNDISIELEDSEYFSYINDIDIIMSTKIEKEISSFKRINEIDAIAMIKFIYALKHFDFDKNILTEYSLKKILDTLRSQQKEFLSTSFDTIVAYKENSAICHYSPKENNSKIIRNDSILLIDSGGNYIGGTTDITRVVSLYKDKNKIPKDIKHYYTLVLKSLLALSNQKFPDGYRGAQLDIIARQYLFNECLDYGHGTGHGIGNNTSVHYGNNVFSSRAKNDESNILKTNQVQSCEPGVYFENKYGIRLENDTYTKKIMGTDYLTFETLTLCPFDKDLINMDELDKVDIERLHSYNKMVYNKMKKYFKGDILLWLKKCTKYYTKK